MTAAISGHGFEAWVSVKPRCKCGWAGKTYNGDDGEAQGRAREEFERHKAAVRAIRESQTSNVVRVHHPTHPSTNAAPRHLAVVR